MRKNILIVSTVLLYLTGALLTYGGMNATQQYECHNEFSLICDRHKVRDDAVLAIVYALFPPWWFVVLISTGGYQDGFSYTMTPSRDLP